MGNERLSGQAWAPLLKPDRRIRRVTASLSAPRKAMRSLGLPAVIVAAAIFLSMGSGTGLPEGPLDKYPDNHGSAAGVPARPGRAPTVGLESMYNGGPAPAVIDRLVLVSPRHIKLIGAYVTIGLPAMGEWATFPPAASALRQHPAWARTWASRHKPAGAIVPPHQWASIAMGLKPTGPVGTIAGIDVFYHIGSNNYEWQGHVRTVVTTVR